MRRVFPSAASEMSDPAIKLFGRTIPLQEGGEPLPTEAGEKTQDVDKEMANSQIKDPTTDAPEELEQSKEHGSSDANNGTIESHQATTSVDKVTEDTTSKQDQVETDAPGQEKILKKPDKILPCPRCNSMDTKFCYYNNYNVKQPRHFCKNCQRYWTVGGTMRNVPVGAGRRKNKHAAAQQRHIMMLSDAMAATQIDAPDAAHSRSLSCGPSAATLSPKVNGTVLKFGAESHLCESIASILNVGDQKKKLVLNSVASGAQVEEPTCASSVTPSTGVNTGVPGVAVSLDQNSIQGYSNGMNPVQPLQCYPGSSWPFHWCPGWNNIPASAPTGCANELSDASTNASPSPVQWKPPPIVAAPAFCAPAIPFSFVPASFWSCMPNWSSGAWNVPWIGSNGPLSPSSSTSNSICSGCGSPGTLGKHPRDASSQGEDKTEKSLWVPKTLRIDDPDEAAKSSIWSTLGIKPDEGDCCKFRKGQPSPTGRVLHANPAALSRLQMFQEST